MYEKLLIIQSDPELFKKVEFEILSRYNRVMMKEYRAHKDRENDEMD